VPTTIPPDLSLLTALESLRLIGDNTVPGGSIPNMLNKLTKLKALEIQNTGINGEFPDIWEDMSDLNQIALVGNRDMRVRFPQSFFAKRVQLM
jgi:hypothetical protein